MKRIIYYFADSKDDIEKRLETLKRLPTIPERLMITASSSSSSDEIINSSLNSTTSSKSTQESNSVSLYFSNCIYPLLYK